MSSGIGDNEIFSHYNRVNHQFYRMHISSVTLVTHFFTLLFQWPISRYNYQSVSALTMRLMISSTLLTSFESCCDFSEHYLIFLLTTRCIAIISSFISHSHCVSHAFIYASISYCID